MKKPMHQPVRAVRRNDFSIMNGNSATNMPFGLEDIAFCGGRFSHVAASGIVGNPCPAFGQQMRCLRQKTGGLAARCFNCPQLGQNFFGAFFSPLEQVPIIFACRF
jgi:hypothetical protein